MSLVQIDQRYRVTLPREVRQKIRVAKGQEFLLVYSGDDLIMKPLPKDPSNRLDEILGYFTFDRGARRRAEKWLFKEVTTSAVARKKNQKK